MLYKTFSCIKQKMATDDQLFLVWDDLGTELRNRVKQETDDSQRTKSNETLKELENTDLTKTCNLNK